MNALFLLSVCHMDTHTQALAQWQLLNERQATKSSHSLSLPSLGASNITGSGVITWTLLAYRKHPTKQDHYDGQLKDTCVTDFLDFIYLMA